MKNDETHGVGVGETMMDITEDMTKLDETKREEEPPVDDTELNDLLDEAKSKTVESMVVQESVIVEPTESKSVTNESTEVESTEKALYKK